MEGILWVAKHQVEPALVRHRLAGLDDSKHWRRMKAFELVVFCVS